MNKTLKHVAIILDGNRRFAKKLMLKPWKGHEWGAKKIEQLLYWCRDLGIKEVTLFCFSLENFSRPKKEFDYLMGLYRREFKKLKKDKRVMEYGIKIRVIGRREMFPKDIQEAMKEIEEKTKNNNKYTVNFAMAYGGRAEITDAARKLAEDYEKGRIRGKIIDEKVFAKYLYLNSDPDLIIRTGGEKRISNFLIWQGNYSEFVFVEKMWPEIEKKDFLECINEYKRRKRRFGK